MADLDFKEVNQSVQLVGDNELYAADVILDKGQKKLVVSDTIVSIESLQGKNEAASNYFFIDSVADGQTLTINLPLTEGAPAFSDTFTVNVGETKKEFSDRVILELNQDFVNFQPYYRALDIDDNAAIFILAKNIGEAGENTTAGSVSLSGTVSFTLGFDNLERRGTVIQASVSTKDPRLGTFGIEGTVESKDASVEGLFVAQPYDTTPGVVDLNVDGSTTPVVFTFPMDSLDDYFVSEIKFFGRDNGIQFSSFLGRQPLQNGILVEVKTNNNMVMLPPIKTTDDFDDVFSFGGSNFDVYFAAGEDKFTARFLSSAFPLRRSGTFGVGNDDYIKITIRDNLTAVNYLQCIVEGFRQEA